jgi:hypothetical protein
MIRRSLFFGPKEAAAIMAITGATMIVTAPG